MAAGRAYVRMHLHATAAGVELHPLSHALQEFPEVRPQYEAVHRLPGFEPARAAVQMLARTGYALSPSRPSPRRGLAASEVWAYHVVTPILAALLAEQPQFEIELSVSNRADNLLRRRL